MTTEPPFRAEQVGSLLRPLEVKDARAKRERGEIGQADLKSIEDKWISRAVATQASLGLKVVTDGEYRRSFWSRDFFRHLDNVETFSTPDVKRFQGSQPKTLAHRPTARLGSFTDHPMVDHFRFLKSVAPRHDAENDHTGAERFFGASRQDDTRRIGLRLVRGIL